MDRNDKMQQIMDMVKQLTEEQTRRKRRWWCWPCERAMNWPRPRASKRRKAAAIGRQAARTVEDAEGKDG